MIIENKQTFVGYRCPACASVPVGPVPHFTLRSRMLRLPCHCGGSDMTIEAAKGEKVRLTVPCCFCGTQHHYLISESLFFGRELFLLNCQASNMDICFLGSETQVSDAIEANTRELNEMLSAVMEDMPEDMDSEEKKSPLLPDAQIYDILRFLVMDLHEEGKVYCRCTKGDYELEVLQDCVRVYCKHCGAERLFPAHSVESAREFLQLEEITLS